MRALLITVALLIVVAPAAAFAGGSVHNAHQHAAGNLSCTSKQVNPDCGADADLSMIEIQQIASQRQNAVATVSQILASDQCVKCLANIGG